MLHTHSETSKLLCPNVPNVRNSKNSKISLHLDSKIRHHDKILSRSLIHLASRIRSLPSHKERQELQLKGKTQQLN